MADDVRFSIGVNDRTRAAFKKLGKSLGALKSRVFNLKTAVLGLAGVGGFGALTAASFRSVDALAKQADQMGISTEALAGLQHAISITTDGSVNLQKATLNMTRTIRDANNGLATYKRSYKELGLDTKELEKLSPDEQFIEIAEALNKIENQTRRTGIAYDIFGARNAQLINTLALGREGLERMRAEAKALGLSVTRIEAAKIEAANDAFTRVKGVIKGVANQIAVALAPYLEAISKYLVNASIASGGFKSAIGNAINFTIEGVAFLGDSFAGLVRIWHAIRFAFMAFANQFWQSIAAIDRGIVDFLNKLPGVSVEYSTFIQGVADTAQNNLDAQWEKLREKLNQPLPGDAIREWAANIEKNATYAANKVAIAKGKMVNVDEKGNKDTLKNTIKSAADIFGIQKQLSIATILAKTPQAIATAYANAGGFPAGIPAGIATAAKMAGEAAAAGGISLGFGGGGGGSSPGGGGGVPSVPAITPSQATPTQEPEEKRQEQRVTLLTRSDWSGQMKREMLMDLLREADDAGIDLRINVA